MNMSHLKVNVFYFTIMSLLPIFKWRRACFACTCRNCKCCTVVIYLLLTQFFCLDQIEGCCQIGFRHNTCDLCNTCSSSLVGWYTSSLHSFSFSIRRNAIAKLVLDTTHVSSLCWHCVLLNLFGEYFSFNSNVACRGAAPAPTRWRKWWTASATRMPWASGRG